MHRISGVQRDAAMPRPFDWWLLFERVYIRDIVLVKSAGNTGGAILNQLDPIMDLAGPHYPMIVVGGVYPTGEQHPYSSYGPEVDIWAQMSHVLCASPDGPIRYQYGLGTSFAAPAVAGLAAYFLSHLNPEIQNLVRVEGQVARRAKAFIKATAYARLLPPPARTMIAYNGETMTLQEDILRNARFYIELSLLERSLPPPPG